MKTVALRTALCVSLLLAGCATAPVRSVRLSGWRPPEVNTAGLRRLAVVEFQGPAEYGRLAREAIAEKLAPSHTIPDSLTTRRLLPASVPYQGYGLDVPALVRQARAAGFDAVLVGNVDCSGKNDGAVRIGHPVLSSLVRVQLIDTRSGMVRGEAAVKKKWQGQLASSAKAKNSRGNVYTRLTRAAAAEVSAKLAGRHVDIEVPLAEAGAGDDAQRMQEGEEAAKRGDWEAAAGHFDRARLAHPGSHAACYNLGVACEAQGRFDQARHWYSRALGLQQDREEYQLAVRRLGQPQPSRPQPSRPHHLPQRQLAAPPRPAPGAVQPAFASQSRGSQPNW